MIFCFAKKEIRTPGLLVKFLCKNVLLLLNLVLKTKGKTNSKTTCKSKQESRRDANKNQYQLSLQILL